MATAHPENSFSDLIAFDLLPSRLFGGKERESEQRSGKTESDHQVRSRDETFSSSKSFFLRLDVFICTVANVVFFSFFFMYPYIMGCKAPRKTCQSDDGALLGPSLNNIPLSPTGDLARKKKIFQELFFLISKRKSNGDEETLGRPI